MARPPGARASAEAEGRGQGHGHRRQVDLDAACDAPPGRALQPGRASNLPASTATARGAAMADTQLFIDGDWIDAAIGRDLPDLRTVDRREDRRRRQGRPRRRAARRRSRAQGVRRRPVAEDVGQGARREAARGRRASSTAAAREIAEIEARDGGGTIKKAMFADVPGAVSTFQAFAGCAENEPDVDRPRREPVPAREEHRAARAVRRVHRHRAVELPVPHGRLEDRARDRGRQLRRC